MAPIAAAALAPLPTTATWWAPRPNPSPIISRHPGWMRRGGFAEVVSASSAQRFRKKGGMLSRTATGENGMPSGKRVGGRTPFRLFKGGQSISWSEMVEDNRSLAKSLWRGGWIAWWCQLILTSISTVTLTFSATAGGGLQSPIASGLLTSVSSLASVFLSWIWMYRYTRMALTLSQSKVFDPAFIDRVRGATQAGVKLNFIGMALAIVSAEQIVGSLVATALTPARTVIQGAYYDSRPTLTLEAFVLQSNTNALLATFIGLLTSWWINQSTFSNSKRNDPPPVPSLATTTE